MRVHEAKNLVAIVHLLFGVVACSSPGRVECPEEQVEVTEGSEYDRGCYVTCGDDVGACSEDSVCVSFEGEEICVPKAQPGEVCDDDELWDRVADGDDQCRTSCVSGDQACGSDKECQTGERGGDICVSKPPPACPEGQEEISYEDGPKQCHVRCFQSDKCPGGGQLCTPKDAQGDRICQVCPDGQTGLAYMNRDEECELPCDDDDDCTRSGYVCAPADARGVRICLAETRAQAAARLCPEYCEILFGDCFDENCPGATGPQREQIQRELSWCRDGNDLGILPCEVRLRSNYKELNYAQVIVESGCDSGVVQKHRVNPGYPADLSQECGFVQADNGACTQDSDCAATLPTHCVTAREDGGLPAGVCRTESCHSGTFDPNLIPPGEDVILSFDENGDDAGVILGCGVGGGCLVDKDMDEQTTSRCVIMCKQNSDCPRAPSDSTSPGFVCSPMILDGPPVQAVGICAPACEDDADCLDDSDPTNIVQGVCGEYRTCETPCAQDNPCDEGYQCVLDPDAPDSRSCRVIQPYGSNE